MSLFNILVDIAARTANFEAGLTRVERRLDQFSVNAKKNLTSALNFAGVGLSVAAFTQGINKSLEFGEAISNAAKRAGASAKDFSELAYAAKAQNVEMQALSGAIAKMQVQISKGDGVFAAIGVDLAYLKQLDPVAQFTLLAEAISRIEDPATRARAVTAAFGAAGGDLLPLFADGARGIDQLRKAAHEMGQVLDDESAGSLADAKSAIDGMKTSVSGLFNVLSVLLAPAIKSVADGLRTLAGGATQVEKLQTQLEFLEGQRDSIIPVILQFGYVEGGSVVMGPGELDVHIKRIKQEIEELKAAANAPAGSDKGLTPPTGFTDDTAAKAAQNARDRLRDLITTMEQERVTAGLSAEEVARYRLTHGDLAETVKQAGAQGRALAETFVQVAVKNEEANLATQRYAETLQRTAEMQADLRRTLDQGIGESVKETSDENNRALQERAGIFMEEFKKQYEGMSVYAEQAARNTQDIIADALLNGFDKGAKGILQSFGNMLVQLAAQAVAADLAGRIFGKDGGGTGGGWIGAIAGVLGFAAKGGPIKQGEPYMVGERGPEIIIPKQAGFVIPNNRLEDFAAMFRISARQFGGAMSAGHPYLVGERGPEMVMPAAAKQPSTSMVNNFNFTIQTPTGRVPLETQQQMAARAARALGDARRRSG